MYTQKTKIQKIQPLLAGQPHLYDENSVQFRRILPVITELIPYPYEGGVLPLLMRILAAYLTKVGWHS